MSKQVTMSENAWNGDTLLADGTTHTLSDELAGSLVQDGKALYIGNPVSNPGPLGANELAAHAEEHAGMGISIDPASRFGSLGARQVGFNYYSLVYEILIASTAAIANRNALLSYIASTGANMIRIALPCFSSAQYLTLVHSTPAMPEEMTDDNLRATYISALDTAFDAAAAAGLKLYIGDFWNQSFLPVALGETVANGYSSLTTKTAIYMRSAAKWLVNRYKDHPALSVYCIGSEWVTDDAGTTAPTPAQLGTLCETIANDIHAIKNSLVVAVHVNPKPVSVAKTRDTPDEEVQRFSSIHKGVDAIAISVYSGALSFVGCNANDNASFPCSNANTLGFEGIEALLSSLKAIADSLGKSLLLAEIGISTAEESDSVSVKKARIQTAASKYADLLLWWNCQENTLATASSQSTWYIEQSTTRANTFLSLVSAGNKGGSSRHYDQYSGGGVESHRLGQKPMVCMTTTRTAGALLTMTSTATQTVTNLGIAFWLRVNSNLNSFEQFLDFRGSGNTSGAVVLGGSTSGTDIYAEFRNGGGAAGSTSGQMRDYTLGEWHHYAVSFGPLAGTLAMKLWRDGLYWKTVTVSGGAMVGTPAGTVMEVLGGGGGSGAPVSMQDVALFQSITSREVAAHMRGEVLPHALLHVRALENGSIIDLARDHLVITVGSGVSVEAT